MNAIKEFSYEPAFDEWRVKLEPGVLLAVCNNVYIQLLRILYSEKELTGMKAVKEALDPDDLLGPGNGDCIIFCTLICIADIIV